MMLEIEPIPHVTLAQLIETRKQIHARLAIPPRAARIMARASRQHHQIQTPALPPLIFPPPPVTHPPRASAIPLTSRGILREVASFYNLTVDAITSHDRRRRIARPRQIAFYLANKFTANSLPEIGRRGGGGFDHTTVLHAIRRIDKLSQTDAGLASEITQLRARLHNAKR